MSRKERYVGRTAIITLCMLVAAGCAGPSVESVSITSVRLNKADGSKDPAAPATNDIPYGRSATVYAHVKLDGPAGVLGYTTHTQLWEDDGPTGDDQLSKKKRAKIPTRMTRGRPEFTIRCDNNGKLIGNNDTDDDDGTDGETREYEVYPFESDESVSAAANHIVRCVPPEEEEDDDDGSGGSGG